MSFWGVEVRPGKPVVQRFSKARGKLHISQATVTSNVSRSNSYTIHCQCVGEKNPILLCSIATTYQRSCRIDLEFGEEDGDIVLSVTGNAGDYGVHFTGYYFGDATFKDAIGKKKPEEENVAKENAAENSSVGGQRKQKNKLVEKMQRFKCGSILKMLLLIFLVMVILGGITSKFESYGVLPKVCTCWI